MSILITVLVIEKVIQHVAVTLAFVFDWMGIRSTVAVDPAVLAILGGIVAVLFAVGLWGMVTRRPWAANLIIGLALFDIVGEFVAQGTLAITITVSFLVAVTLLVLAVMFRRNSSRTASGPRPVR